MVPPCHHCRGPVTARIVDDMAGHAGTHPTIAERLVEQMIDVARLVDVVDAATFATDDGWTALQRLLASLEAATRAAAPRRATPT